MFMAAINRWRGPFQFAQFSLIGGLNALVDLGTLNLLLFLWPTKDVFVLFLYNSIAYTMAILNSYLLNSRLTFRHCAMFSAREKISFGLQATCSLLISNGIFLFATFLLEFFPIPLWLVYNISKTLSMALSSTASFFFMKYFVFRKKQDSLS